ncbi:hypothetical protein HDZ31DRAFT_68656 [Schizophyllum fasciatum]
MANGYADGTAETYGSGLLVYHVYCDLKGITEEDRAPAAAILISSFAASLAGSYGGGTVANYVYGVRAWHLIHGARWSMNKDELDVLLKAADKLAPPTSKRKQRQPYTVEILARIRPHFDLQIPLDAATWACLTTTFWSGARLGEFTVANLQSFDPQVHVKPSDMSSVSDRQGNKQQKFHIPRTKANQIHGEDVFWAEQPGAIDPKPALDAHLALNTPGPNDALFSYPHGRARARRPLTKHTFLKRVAAALRREGMNPLQGHGLRIGSVLEYLLRGLPFEVVKQIGRWASDSFQKYLRKHAQILAPYMQAKPQVQEAFTRYTMVSLPPVR